MGSLPGELDAARRRIDSLRGELAVVVPRTAEFVGGGTNDLWLFADFVLRVCWRADRARLVREARLLDALPAAIPHASVIDFGRTEELSWLLCRRVRGRPLSVLAPDLGETARRGLVEELATILAALHAWTPPPEIAALLTERPELDLAEPLSVWAADLVALPVGRALAIAEHARTLPDADPVPIDAAVERIRSLAGSDPFAVPREPWVVVHGNATAGNVLVHGARISALLDFEWARMGPPDLELVSLVAEGQRLDWLEEDYPQLFAAPDLDRRLWLYELASTLRGSVSSPDRIHALRGVIDAPMTHWPKTGTA